MHYSIFQFFTRSVRLIDIKDKSILDVGSLNVNGSLRDIIIPTMSPSKYIGTDIRAGNYVDVIVPAMELISHFGMGSFDVVICTEMLEHAQDWRASINNIKGVLKAGGLLVLTTRSMGFPLHSYPDDYWRFEVDDMIKIFADFDNLITIEQDWQDPGVFIVGNKPKPFNYKFNDLSFIEVYSMEAQKK